MHFVHSFIHSKKYDGVGSPQAAHRCQTLATLHVPQANLIVVATAHEQLLAGKAKRPHRSPMASQDACRLDDRIATGDMPHADHALFRAAREHVRVGDLIE